jgi:hypothetical protein
MRKYIIETLDDPNGVSQEAYDALIALAEIAGDYGENLDDIILQIGSADGRYFLHEGHDLH